MKPISVTKSATLVLATGTLLLPAFLLRGCSLPTSIQPFTVPSPTTTPICDITPTPTYHFPSYIANVSPLPQATVMQTIVGGYPIHATIRPDHLPITENMAYFDWNQRVEILLDNTPLEVQVYGQGEEVVYVNAQKSILDISHGEHFVHLNIYVDRGRVEYTWQFVVLTASDLGLPAILDYVRPFPDSVVGPVDQVEVCVAVITSELYHGGFWNPDEEDYPLRHVSLTLDADNQRLSTNEREYYGRAETALIIIYDEDGNEITSFAGPREILCFRDALAPGEHTAVFSAQKISGEIIEYSWTFQVVGE